MKKIVLTGKNGQVGWELQRTLAPMGKVFAFDRDEMNLSNQDQIVKIIREIKPNLIVNAAAYTAVDKAETDSENAFAINGKAPGILAEEAKKLNAQFIHYSTDYVFDGTSKTPYTDWDETCPLNVYGQSKLQGENAIKAIGGNYFILRTSWVYGMRGKNFLLTMLKLAAERDSLKIVGDQFGAPTWSRMIAEATAQITSRHAILDLPINGVYHLTSSGVTSWYQFAEAIFTQYAKLCARNGKEFRIPILSSIRSEEYPTPAKRPHYSVLASGTTEDCLNIYMPHWEEALRLCLESNCV